MLFSSTWRIERQDTNFIVEGSAILYKLTNIIETDIKLWPIGCQSWRVSILFQDDKSTVAEFLIYFLRRETEFFMIT